MISTEAVMEILKSHCLVVDHEILPREHVRIGTKLTMLDGSGIDVFLERGSLTRDAGYALSDLGQTVESLAEYGVRYRERVGAIRSAIDSAGVRLLDDRLVLELDAIDQLREGVITLAQACLRVSCIAYTRKAPRQKEFGLLVRKALDDTGLEIKPNYNYQGPYDQDVKVDYRVTKVAKPAAVLKLGHRHFQANELFRKWADLREANITDRRVTIYDDSREPEYKADIERLNKVSEVVAVSNRKMIDQILRQAA